MEEDYKYLGWYFYGLNCHFQWTSYPVETREYLACWTRANVHCFKKCICAYAIGLGQNLTKFKTIFTGIIFEGLTDNYNQFSVYYYVSLFPLHTG
jgi:hypothetical protein